MSNINAEIESWRRSFTDLSDSQLDELEDHLRQQIEALGAQGLHEREAFTVAAMRCGRPAQLSYEYARADSAAAWSGRLRWMIVGFLVCTVSNGLIATLNTAFGAVLITRGAGLAVTIAMRMLLLLGIVAAAVAVWRLWMKQRPGSLDAAPPRWLTSGWMLAILVAVVPWVMAAANMVGMTMFAHRFLSPNDFGQLALSGAVTWMVLPFTTPLILLIVAVSLTRRQRNDDDLATSSRSGG